MNQVRHTVLFVSVGVTYGGAETYYVKLARVLQSHFKIVAVVCSPRLAEEFRALGMDVAYTGDGIGGAKRYGACLRACREMVRRHRPGVVHLNGQPESYLALFLRLLGLRVITTRHTPFTDLFLKEGSRVPVSLKRWMVIASLRCAEHTICVSHLLKRQLAQYLPAHRLTFIPTWVDASLLERYERPVPSQPLRALFLGRVVRNKGIFDLIEAIRLCDAVHLTVVGEGDQMAEARHLAANLPITFAGFSRDTAAAYRAADLVIFASPEGFEGLPQVPMEALAMGVPCLASDISSVLEIAEVATGEPPVLALYRQGDVADMVRALNALVADPAALAQLSMAGRRQVERRFTVAAIMNAYLAAFQSALE